MIAALARWYGAWGRGRGCRRRSGLERALRPRLEELDGRELPGGLICGGMPCVALMMPLSGAVRGIHCSPPGSKPGGVGDGIQSGVTVAPNAPGTIEVSELKV
jgi:hypothetical protein